MPFLTQSAAVLLLLVWGEGFVEAGRDPIRRLDSESDLISGHAHCRGRIECRNSAAPALPVQILSLNAGQAY